MTSCYASYDLPHTLPFVCDQVVTFPRSTSVMIVATRAEFVTRFAKAWQGMGFVGTLLVPDECEGLPTDLPGVKRGPFKELIGQAHMFIFEFGLATQRPDEPAQRRNVEIVGDLDAHVADQHEHRPTRHLDDPLPLDHLVSRRHGEVGDDRIADHRDRYSQRRRHLRSHITTGDQRLCQHAPLDHSGHP